MSNFKKFNKGIKANVKSIQRDFQVEPTEIGKSRQKVELHPVDISKVPKDQRDKLESYIKQWQNPSKWYESRMEGLEWFLKVAEMNNVAPENVEFVVDKQNGDQPVLKPVLKDAKVQYENVPKLDDINRLRKFLKQYPKYKIRVENGENIADLAISIIKEYSEKEERKNLGLE